MNRGINSIVSNTHRLFLVGVLLFSSFWIYGQSTVISLLQKESGASVPYANICWQTLDNSSSGNGISDEKGKFQMGVTPGSDLIIHISSIGFKVVNDTLRVEQGHTFFMEEDVLNLEQVTVTGTRTPHILKEAPVLTQMIAQKEIARADAATITDILETEVPGIELARHGFGQTMSVQGLEPQYTLILVDGERLAGETGGNIDYSRINAANIERVEIVRGASSALYGSNAMGGVINIITRKPRHKFDISANVKYRQRNQKNYFPDDTYYEDYEDKFYRNMDKPNLNGNLSLGFRNRNFYSNTFLNAKSTDGYVLSDREGMRFYYPELDTTLVEELHETAINGSQDYTITQKIGYDDGKRWAFELRGNHYRHEEFLTRVYNWQHDMFKNYSIGGFAKYRMSANDNIQLSYNTDIFDKYDVKERKNDTAVRYYRNTFHNAKLNYTTRLGAKHNLFVGIENLYEILSADMFVWDASEIQSKSTNDLVFVAQDEYTISDDISAVIGVRGGYHSTFAFHASPSITLRYRLKPFNLRLNYARGYRSPTLKELYMNWSHLGMFQIVGSTDLKPETNNYCSVSLDYLNLDHQLNATLIGSYNQIDHKIEGIWVNDSMVNYINISKVKVVNLEAMLKWRLHTLFNLKAGYVYSHHIKDRDVVALSDISPHALTAQLEFLYEKNKYHLTANLSGKLLSTKVVKGTNMIEESPLYGKVYEARYPAYAIFNLTVNQRYGKHYMLGLGVRNLLNYTAPTVTMNTTASVGRRFFVSFTYNF